MSHFPGLNIWRGRAIIGAGAEQRGERMTMAKFSRARLSRLREVLSWHVEHGEVPGLVALLSRHDEAHVEVLGKKGRGAAEPMRQDSLFRISSMTKPITAAAALILIEECKLRLDDPIDRWLPELRERRVLRRIDSALDDTVPAKRPISVRDLLTFRMGFGQMMARPGAYPILQAAHERRIGMGPPRPDEMPAPDEWLRRVGELPLMYQPGERWMYNTGSDVLGVLISRCSGKPLPTFLEERIFQPLGMKDTSFGVPSRKLDRLTTCYGLEFASGSPGVFDPVDGQWSREPAFPSGAAGLVSTLSDFFSFAQMLQRQGKHGSERILSRAAVELMTTDHLTVAQKASGGLSPGDFDSSGWGFGVSVVTRREDFASLGTYGWDGGLGTTWSNDPREDMILLLLTQRCWTAPTRPPVALDFATAAYQAIDD
jgi:CubicO group peptidase (beta-lactamase class C family)